MSEVVLTGTPEFSRVISVSRLPPHGVEYVWQAKADERAALAKRFGLLRLDRLQAELTVTPDRLDTVIATGKISAEYQQNCVVTLEPLTDHLDLDIRVTFIPAGQADEIPAGADDNGDEDIDSYAGDKIDLGEMVAQQLGVNINPYPRKADATLPPIESGGKAAAIYPLADLTRVIKNKDKTKD